MSRSYNIPIGDISKGGQHIFSFKSSLELRRNLPPLPFYIEQPRGWRMFRGNQYDLGDGICETFDPTVMFREDVPSGTSASTIMVGVAWQDKKDKGADLGLKKIKSNLESQMGGRIINEEFTTLDGRKAFIFILQFEAPNPDGSMSINQSLNVGIGDDNLLWSITCMTSEDKFKRYEEIFKKTINSFRVIDGPELKKLREELEKFIREEGEEG